MAEALHIHTNGNRNPLLLLFKGKAFLQHLTLCFTRRLLHMAEGSSERGLDSSYEKTRRLTIAMSARRMQSICARLSLHSARLCAVPSNYYSLTLRERAALVCAPGVHHMCKTVVFENTKATVADCHDAFHSRFYAVIVQYTAEVSMSKFENFTFQLAQENGRAVSKRRFHWRLASNDDSLRLTGYVNNAGTRTRTRTQSLPFNTASNVGAVAPIGLQDESLKVIVCAAILQLCPGYMWMGAGAALLPPLKPPSHPRAQVTST